MVTKIGMADEVADPYPCAKFQGGILATLYSQAKPPAPIFYDEYVKNVPVGLENTIVHFDPLYEKKR